MKEINEANMIEKMMYSINNFKDEMIKSMNYIRGDIYELKNEVIDLKKELREYKEENNKRWDENDKRWDENDKRWDENDKRWEENNKRWEENNKRWEENSRRWDENNKLWQKYEENRKSDRMFLLDTLTRYDLSISEQLGDPNVDKMRKFV